MVCLNCGHETQVTNSRPQKRSNSIWRRRFCPLCQSIFTTHEQIDLSAAWKVISNRGHVSPFLRDRLFVSILEVCDQTDNPYESAAALTATAINQLQRLVGTEPVESAAIAHVTATVLKRFQPLLAVRYASIHPMAFNTKKLARGLI